MSGHAARARGETAGAEFELLPLGGRDHIGERAETPSRRSRSPPKRTPILRSSWKGGSPPAKTKTKSLGSSRSPSAVRSSTAPSRMALTSEANAPSMRRLASSCAMRSSFCA